MVGLSNTLEGRKGEGGALGNVRGAKVWGKKAKKKTRCDVCKRLHQVLEALTKPWPLPLETNPNVMVERQQGILLG